MASRTSNPPFLNGVPELLILRLLSSAFHKIVAQSAVDRGTERRPAFLLPDMGPQNDGVAFARDLDFLDFEPEFLWQPDSLRVTGLKHTSILGHSNLRCIYIVIYTIWAGLARNAQLRPEMLAR